LAKTIEKELLVEYEAATPLAVRRVRQAARFSALAEATLQSIGRDPRATRRTATALQASVDRLLAALTAIGAKRIPRRLTLAEEIAARTANASATKENP
jgi:hypothetical protein